MRLIDADALKELFPDNGEGSWTYNITARMYIDKAPTLELQMGRMTNGIIIPIERPTGEWEEIIELGHRCSICHGYGFKTNYCPNCGALMKMAVNLCDDCKLADDCNPTLKNRDGVSTTQCSKYEPYKKGAEE